MNRIYGILAVTAFMSVCFAFPSPFSATRHIGSKKSGRSEKAYSSRSTNPDFNGAYELTQTIMNYGDANGDQQLSHQEIKNFYKLGIGFSDAKSEEAATAMIERGDSDGDNQLNLQETFVTMLYIFNDNHSS